MESSETILSLGSAQDYVSSPEDPRVATVVGKYFAATSDEKMIEQMDEGNVTTMMEMLQAQSELMKDVEAKLAGAKTVSWEAQQKAEAERELADLRAEVLRAEIQENEALAAVGQLIDLMQGLSQADKAPELLNHLRMMHMHRGMRHHSWEARGDVDDWAAMRFLREAADVADNLTAAFPDLGEELTAIRRSIDEQLARSS